MKKKIINVSSENQSMAIRAINGIYLLQESWMTEKIRETKEGSSMKKEELLKTKKVRRFITKNRM